MNEVQTEAELTERARHYRTLGHATVSDDIKKLEHQIDSLKEALHLVLHRVQQEAKEKLPPTPVYAKLTEETIPVQSTDVR